MWSITIYVPVAQAPAVRAALAESGGGAIGRYDSCSFSAIGTGRFRPLAGANPAIGTIGAVEEVVEERIETVVAVDRLQAVVAAVKRAHPYEEPAIHLTQIVDYKAFLTTPSASISEHAEPVAPLRAPCSIVLEGLDGVGKSTAAAALVACLGATSMRTPPDSMRSFRSFFVGDGVADSGMRRAYYMVGNFLCGTEMAAAVAAGTTVVVDRYYASTYAYTLGKAPADLPPAGDAAYAWPAELARPTFMLLLTLPEADRIARRAARVTEAETGEEALLRARPDVPLRINEAFRRFGCAEVALDAADGVDVVVAKILRACVGL